MATWKIKERLCTWAHLSAGRRVLNRKDAGGEGGMKEGWRARRSLENDPVQWNIWWVVLATREEEATTSAETRGRKLAFGGECVLHKGRDWDREKSKRREKGRAQVEGDLNKEEKKEGGRENHSLFIISLICCLDPGSDHTLELWNKPCFRRSPLKLDFYL